VQIDSRREDRFGSLRQRQAVTVIGLCPESSDCVAKVMAEKL